MYKSKLVKRKERKMQDFFPLYHYNQSNSLFGSDSYLHAKPPASAGVGVNDRQTFLFVSQRWLYHLSCTTRKKYQRVGKWDGIQG